MGAKGGARIAHGNPRLFAEALAVQLELTGVEVREIMDAQRAMEYVAAELAAENATAGDIARLRKLVTNSKPISPTPGFAHAARPRLHVGDRRGLAQWRAGGRADLAAARSWPTRNRTLTPPVARHIVDVTASCVDLIEARDAAAARRLMTARA